MYEKNKDETIHVFIDTETTGLGHKDKYEIREDAVVEVGIAYMVNNKEPFSKSWLCQPDSRFLEGNRADKALEVSGLSYRTIYSAPRDYIIAQMVRNHLHSLGNIELHAYNIEFDRPFLEKEPWDFNFKWGADPMLMAKEIFQEEQWLSLVKAMERLNIVRHGKPHSAGSDADGAMRVYYACLKKMEEEENE